MHFIHRKKCCIINKSVYNNSHTTMPRKHHMTPSPPAYKRGRTGRRPGSRPTPRSRSRSAFRTTSATRPVQRADKPLTLYRNMMNKPFSSGPAQLPDSYRGHTVSLVLQSSHVITSDATGKALIAFSPELDAFSLEATSFTGTTATVGTWAEHPDYASGLNISSSAAVVRFLNLALKTEFIGTQDTISGLQTTVFHNFVTTPSWDISGYPNDQGARTNAVTRKDHITICKPYDDPKFAAMGNPGHYYMNGVIIAFTGLPASSECIHITARLFCEMVAEPSSTLAQSATPSPPGTTPGTGVSFIMEA
jgi:hypothetical protein